MDALVQITVGGVGLLGALGAIARAVRRGRNPEPQAGASIEKGVQLLKAAVLQIEAAVADLPAMQATQDAHSVDIRKLKMDMRQVQGDISDLRRENEERDARERRRR